MSSQPAPKTTPMDQDLHLQLKFQSFQRDGEKLLVTYKGWTDRYTVPREFIKQYGKTIIGTVVNYRHVDPKQEVDSFLGKVVNARILRNGAELEVDVLIEGDTEFQQKVQKLVEEGKLGFSPEILFSYDSKSGQLHKVEFIGGGLTPTPVCEDCFPKAMKYVAGEKSMSEEELKKQLALYEQNIKNLEGKLKDSEALNKTFAAKLKEFEQKTKSEESEELLNQIKEFEQKNKDLETELEKAQTAPLRQKIISLQGLEGEDAEKREKELETFTKEQLEQIYTMIETTLKTAEVKAELTFPAPPTSTSGQEKDQELSQNSVKQLVAACEKNPNLLYDDNILEVMKKQMDAHRYVAQMTGGK